MLAERALVVNKICPDTKTSYQTVSINNKSRSLFREAAFLFVLFSLLLW